MYKLLLVTDRQDVRQAFESITNWGQMMFRPITIIDSVEEALQYLQCNSVDALGYCITGDDVAAMRQYVADHPSLPVFQSHADPALLAEEMQRTRRFLDRVHMDDSDDFFEDKVVLQMLRDELMNQLLAGDIATREELLGRVKLVRADASVVLPCYLYDFDLPQGEVYLADRWHYGRERLQSALRNNFFSRYVDGIYYDVAVLTPRHIRVFACPRMDSELAEKKAAQMVKKHIEKVVGDIKNYLDLDLDLEQVTTLHNMFDLIGHE